MERSEILRSCPAIIGSEAVHASSVLRLKPGDNIVIFDGEGIEYEALIQSISPEIVEIVICRELSSNAESPVQIIIGQSLLKEKKMDGLIRQSSELGIVKWIPFISERSIPRPDAKRLKARMERWRSIAKESLKQCKRSRIPEIEFARSFESVLESGKSCDIKLVFWENETNCLNPGVCKKGNDLKIIALLGPEGGFTAEEVNMAKCYGFSSVSLGPRILKAETAAVAACAIIQYTFGDMG